MKKLRKSFIEIDILAALMFVSVVIYFAYVMSSSAINKRYQTEQKEIAVTLAENIMNRTLSRGVYSLISEPIEANTNENVYLPIDSSLDAPQIPNTRGYKYRIKVENGIVNGGTNTNLKKITVTVSYPAKVSTYKNKKDPDYNPKDIDKTIIVEESRYVTLTTYKASEQYIS